MYFIILDKIIFYFYIMDINFNIWLFELLNY